MSTSGKPEGVMLTRGDFYKTATLGILAFLVEAYDLLAASIAAGIVFPKVIFPPKIPPSLSIVLSLIVGVLVAYVMRPVGALLFGHFGDRWGRKRTISLVLILVGIGSLIIAMAPSYATAGYLGLFAIIIGRIIVGLAFGGEWGGSVSIVVEQAAAIGSKWRGFWGGFSFSGLFISSVIASAFLAYLLRVFPGNSFYTIGWRIAFYTGAALAIVIGLVIFLAIRESMFFEEAKRKQALAKAPSIEVFKKYGRAIVGGALIQFQGSFMYYVAASYGPIYATLGAGFSREAVLLSISAASLATFLLTLVYGALGDAFGRRRMILINSLITMPIAAAWPVLVLTKDFLLLVLAQVFMMAMEIGNDAVLQALSAEQFPTQYRYAGVSLAMQIGGAFGGSCIPLLAALVDSAYTERWWVISSFLVVALVLAMVGALLQKETSKEKLT